MTVAHYTVADAIGWDEARAIVRLVNSVWPATGRSIEDLARGYLASREKRACLDVFVVWDGTEVVAHAKVLARTVRFDGGELTVMGLASVCTKQERRGEGLGKAVVREAFALVDSGQYAVALFQTSSPVFYGKLGAAVVHNAFENRLADDPKKWPFWDPSIMIYPAHALWPTGTIDLNGPAF